MVLLYISQLLVEEMMMRKSLHQGTKADVIKRRAKELNLPCVDTSAKQPKRIITYNHPWVLQ